ncbi:hypothetical protein ABZ570_20105 [Micromonospora sp. NPDC007271]|uniref:hypothetical protein n=1 Tax=Micromonospora sp. NPDC007271 TaxID=3154587 RepID=UPI0033F77E6D
MRLRRVLVPPIGSPGVAQRLRLPDHRRPAQRSPHTVEIWYAEHHGVRCELRADLPGTVAVSARFVTDPAKDALARRLLAAKYQGWREGGPLSDWAATSLVVALDPPPRIAPATADY